MAKEPKLPDASKIAKELAKADRELRTKLIEYLAKEIGSWEDGEMTKDVKIDAAEVSIATKLLRDGNWKFSVPQEPGNVFVVNRPEVEAKKAKKAAAKPGTRRAGRDPAAE